MQSKATTVEQYLAELPADRREAIGAVRSVILENLSDGYEEGMQYGMIGYYVPHRVYPPGYHCNPRQPLPFASLASQKNHMAIYMMCIYGDAAHEAWFCKAWAASGKKKPDMGKGCIRFKKLDDVPLDVIGEAIKRVPVAKYIARYEFVRAAGGERASKRSAATARAKNPVKTTARQSAVKKTAKKAMRTSTASHARAGRTKAAKKRKA